MGVFRDQKAQELGIEIIVHTNWEAINQGINPFDHGPAFTNLLKTQALKDALDEYCFDAAFGGGLGRQRR